MATQKKVTSSRAAPGEVDFDTRLMLLRNISHLPTRCATNTLMIDNNEVLITQNDLATCPAKKFSCFLVATLR
ncbi:MAG: hypothetical protein PHP85_05855 [Gallionella sp.]|nr:hypothetical protein [Gallionella sp.]